jgi:hypothetical protein
MKIAESPTHMKIREWEFEGTWEDFSRVAAVLRGENRESGTRYVLTENASSSEQRRAQGSAKRFVSTAQAKRILEARPLSPPMRQCIEALQSAGDRWTSSEQLTDAMGFGRDDVKRHERFRSTLGAFCKRIRYHAEISANFFDTRSSDGRSEYRLPLSVRQAIEELGWFS